MFFLFLLSGTFGISSSALQQYYYMNVQKSWLEAQSYCRATYIDLATVGSMEDMNRLKAAVDPVYTGAVWIGLKKHWVLSTGENISAYNNWVPGQPNEINMEAACGVHTAHGWHDYYCSTVFYFICFDDRSNSSGTFILIRSRMTWTQAQTYCSQNYANLASIHNAQEQQQIFNVVGNSTNAWFGLISGQWSDEGFSTFRYWANGQAFESVSTDECAAMMMSDSGKWNQRQCVLQNPFICYGEGTGGYILVQTSKNWYDAQTYCRTTYTDLASIRSPWEQKQVTSLVTKGISAWVGLFLDTWQWSDQWSLLFRNWASGQPSLGAGSCSALVMGVSGKWIADNCNLQQPFICYGGES
ncbi:hypothetical protein SRHO_G00238030 [Serrasalmus rhombeus]